MAKRTKDPTGGSELHMVERPTIGGRIADIVVILLCALVAFCSVIPMWHVLMASLSDGKTLLATEGLLLLPVGNINLDAYKAVFRDSSIIMGYANTLLYVVAATALGMFINITAGYVLSRRSKLKPILVLFCVFCTLFSGGVIPLYMVVRGLGLLGTRWALIIPGCTMPISAVMMMNAFNSVPHELYEAARIDGAGHVRTMVSVMLPGAMNLGTVLILNSVVSQWNAWYNASIYVTNQRDCWPLQLWIQQIIADNENFYLSANPDYTRYVIQYAVIIISVVPILVALPFFQDKLEKGVIGGGIKG